MPPLIKATEFRTHSALFGFWVRLYSSFFSWCQELITNWVKVLFLTAATETMSMLDNININLYGTCRFQDIIFQHKFLNRIWELIKNSDTGYDYLFKNNRLLFSRTIDYCFPYWFWNFCKLIIAKQGIKMQIFPERVMEILDWKWASPRQVTFKSLSPPP